MQSSDSNLLSSVGNGIFFLEAYANLVLLIGRDSPTLLSRRDSFLNVWQIYLSGIPQYRFWWSPQYNSRQESHVPWRVVSSVSPSLTYSKWVYKQSTWGQSNSAHTDILLNEYLIKKLILTVLCVVLWYLLKNICFLFLLKFILLIFLFLLMFDLVCFGEW